MITHDYRLVLIDFGHSEKVKKLIKHRIGTPAYRGPEVPDETCDENEYYAVERAELYALGCTLFTIMFQNIPFKNEGEKDKRFTSQAFHDAYEMDLADTYQKFFIANTQTIVEGLGGKFTPFKSTSVLRFLNIK